MKSPYRIIFSERAEKNLADIKRHLQVEVGEELAIAALNYINNQIYELVIFPYRFPIISPKNDLRRMPINKYTYSVFYRIEGKVVKVYHIRHQAQSPYFST